MPRAPSTAVILAAGMGTRLRGVLDDAPKGLLELDGEPLVGRALRLLRERGVERVVIVAGYRADAYVRFAEGRRGVEVVHNRDFATTGTLASLAVALDVVREGFVLLESDLVYEARALDALFAHPADDVVLASGPTGAGDEVWIDAPAGRLRAMSKERSSLDGACGELVGLCRLSPALGEALGEAHRALARERGHDRSSYETDGLVRVAASRPVAVHVVEDLLWGEIDDAGHHRRVTSRIWPAIRARES